MKQNENIFVKFAPVEEFLNYKSKHFAILDVAESYKFCELVANKHYENFPVGSFLLPKEERRFLYSIYAFSRLADDIADSCDIPFSQSERLIALNKLERNILTLKEMTDINNPIFLALKNTIEVKNLQIEPFLRLLTAFKMDANFVQPNTWNDLETYCAYSANPIGELVLKVFGEDDSKKIIFSNMICTGLQLVNFWQDLSVDMKNDRVYIPSELFSLYNIDHKKIKDICYREKFELLLIDILKRTSEYFLNGWKLVLHLKNKRLKYEINATIIGGLKILKKEEKYGYNLLFNRPKLNYFDYIYILINAFI